LLNNFPGLLNYNSKGLILEAIHADWPIYPPGHGWQLGLRTLANYPFGTEFYEISDIDRCKLFINFKPKKTMDLFAYKHYHCALWHEDLIELKNLGFIKGVRGVSEYEYDLWKFNKLKNDLGNQLNVDDDGNIIFYFKDDKNKLIQSVYKKPINDYDEEEFGIFEDCVIIPKCIKLTRKGMLELAKLSQNYNLNHKLNEIVNPLIKIDRFDTAIREASLLIEFSIKRYHNIKLFGQKLIDFHIKKIIENNNNFYSSAIKSYRSELRTVFKFIRNDFAHNFKVISKEQCRVIIFRINDVYNEFKEVISAYFK
jgi:hypothetical protein